MILLHQAFVNRDKLLRLSILLMCLRLGNFPLIRRRAVTYPHDLGCVSGVLVASVVLNDCKCPFSGCGTAGTEQTAFLSATRALRCGVQWKALRN